MNKDFDIEQFSGKNKERSQTQFGLGLSKKDIPYLIIALTGEVGEFANAYKKSIRKFNPGTGRDWEEIGVKDMALELGDIQTYLDLLAQALGVDLSEITREKFNLVSDNIKCPIKIK